MNIFCHTFAQSGGCRRGANCHFPHIKACRNFQLTGSCTFGPKCHYAHIAKHGDSGVGGGGGGHHDPTMPLADLFMDPFMAAFRGMEVPPAARGPRAPASVLHFKPPLAPASAAAPHFTLGERVKARFSSTSVTWKDATVARLPSGKPPELVFDGFSDAVPVPADRIQKLKHNLLPTLPAAASAGPNVRLLPRNGKLATNIRALLAEAPGGEIDGASFGARYAKRFREPLVVDKEKGEKLKDLLARAEASGSCRLEMRPAAAAGPDGKVKAHPPILYVHAAVHAAAPAAGKGGGGGGKGAGKGVGGGGGGGRAWDEDDSDDDSSYSSLDSFKGTGKKDAAPCKHFAHSGSSGCGGGSAAVPSVCRAFARGHCPRGDACLLLHPKSLVEARRAHAYAAVGGAAATATAAAATAGAAATGAKKAGKAPAAAGPANAAPAKKVTTAPLPSVAAVAAIHHPLVVGAEAVYRASDGARSLCVVLAVHSDAAGGGVAVRLSTASGGRERDTLPSRLDASPAAVAAARAAEDARAVACLYCLGRVDPAACVTCPATAGGGEEPHWVCVECLNGQVASFSDQAAEGGLAAFSSAGGKVRCAAPGCGGDGGGVYSDQLLAARLEPENWDALEAARHKLVEQRCIATAATAAKAEAERLAVLSAEERAFLAAKDHAENAILCLACPACGQVFEDFSGCAALSCSRAGCGRAFCGFCLADCGKDAHAHVRGCKLGTGDWGSKVAVEAAQRRVAEGKLSTFLAGRPVGLRGRLLDHLAPLLALHGIDAVRLRKAAAAAAASS